MRKFGVVTCTLGDIAAEAPLPSEFRIFKAGLNDTSKGKVLFDAVAAQAVMASYAQHGVELMIDLNHDSLEELPAAMRSDASDARGWFALELRGGELWATNVRWTPDGEERLRSRKQRYISPAFTHDTLTNGQLRPLALINAALCAMPATHNATPLVATLDVKLRAADWLRKIKMQPKRAKR